MNSERGFTLVEMLVSVAILSIAFAVLFGAIGDSLDRARKSKDEATAASLVQSLAARVQSDPSAGDSSGVYSNGFRWRVVVRPYGDRDDAKAWHMQAYVVRATVSWPHGARSLSALRLVPPPPATP